MVFHRQGKDPFHFGRRSATIFTQLLILFLASNTADAVILEPLSTSEVMFQLYTREKPITPHLVNDSVENLNVSKQTVIVIHGFTGSGKAASVTLIRDASLFVQDVNMVVMDWGILAKGPWYEQAVNNTDKAAVALARFIEALFNEGLSSERLTVVGFSLGAQVAGIAAEQLRTTIRLKRIVGLDAARPMFDRRPPKDRLDPEDAEFVMSIHTAGDFLAFYDPIGHADFYPNGGKSPQPTCQDDELKMICSHFMAPLLFVESIYSADAFLATRCDSWQAYRNKSCLGQERVIMGLNTPSTARGKFYLDTNLTPPYGRNSNPSIPLNEPSMMMASEEDEDLENNEVKRHPKPIPTGNKTGSNPEVGEERKPKNLDISSSEGGRTVSWTPLAILVIYWTLA